MTLINSSLLNNLAQPPHIYTSDTTHEALTPVSSSSASHGKKHENLMRLRFLQSHSSEEFEVPLPFGLTSEEVEPYLRKKVPEFFEGWQKLKETYEQDPVHFFKDKSTFVLIEQIKNHVISAFASLGAPWEARLNQWLKPDCYYMVRSSGAEDGKTANAGGNLSLNYVLSKDVGSSMGKVIASYFDKRSLQNQSKGGTNPFAACPLSVTSQELIGEPMGGEKDPANIPVSAVLFSNEPLYIGGEEFRIMRLSATRGHGEGVVGNEGIATDTFIMLQSRVHPDKLYTVDNISSKPERLAPVEGKLQTLLNPRELIDAPTINKAILQRLFNLGIEVEQDLFSGKPADIELVIKKDKIYLVQAREINRPIKTVPRYLNLEDCPTKAQAMKVLIPGHMQAEVLNDPSQILVIDTLEEAQFQEGDFKLIIVKNDEPANSHPMINFSERGIHVFYSPEGFELPAAGEKFLVCPQQGIVACGNPSSFKFKDGYIDHPASIQFSSQPLPFLTPDKKLVEKLNLLIRQLKAENCTEVGLKAVQDLKTCPAIEDFSKKVTQAKAFSEQAQRLQKLFQKTMGELEESLKKGSRLENLFYIKAIRNLLDNSPFSILSLTKILDQTLAFEQKASDRLSKEVVIETLDPKTKIAWESFLLDVDTTASETEIKSLQRLLETLGSIKPLWLTFYFVPRQGKLSPQELLKELLNELDEISFNFIDQLKNQPFHYFKEQAFIEKFKNSRPLARLIALRYLSQAVAFQDKKLKVLQLSFQPLNTKILAFKKELASYLWLMQNVAESLVGEGKFHLPEEGLSNYLLKLHSVTGEIYQKAEIPDLLKSSGFNVAVAKLGSGTFFPRQLPNTLEDLFTLAHQNLLACIALLYKENLPLLETLHLPNLLETAIDRVSSLGKIDLIGIEQQGEALILSYNAPQRYHSSTFQLNFKNGTLHFSAQMLGENRMRWTSSQNFIHLLDEWKILPCKKLVQRGDILDITWSIKDADQMNTACEVLSKIYEFTLNRSSNGSEFADCLRDLCKNNELVLSNLLTSITEQADPAKNLDMKENLLMRFVENPTFKNAVNQYADPLLTYAKKNLQIANNAKDRKVFELIECLIKQGAIGPVISNLLTSLEQTNDSTTSQAEKKLLDYLIEEPSLKNALNKYSDRLLAYVKRELQSSDFGKAFNLMACLLCQDVIGAREEAAKLLEMVANDQIRTPEFTILKSFIRTMEDNKLLPDLLQFTRTLLNSSFEGTQIHGIRLFKAYLEQELTHGKKVPPEEVCLMLEKLAIGSKPKVKKVFINYLLQFAAQTCLTKRPNTLHRIFVKLFNDPDIDVLKQIHLFLLFRRDTLCITFYKSLQQAQINLGDINWAERLNNIALEAKEFKCPSPLASLYRKIMMGKDDAEIREGFTNMPVKDRNLIFEVMKVLVNEFKEENIFNDVSIFNQAVEHALIVKLDQLSEDEKNIAYDKIFSYFQTKNSGRTWPREEAKEQCKKDLLLLASALP